MPKRKHPAQVQGEGRAGIPERRGSSGRLEDKRVERIWRREGLKMPQKQKKKGRLWLYDGSGVRLRPERPNYVWSFELFHNRTGDGRVLRALKHRSDRAQALNALTFKTDHPMGVRHPHRAVRTTLQSPLSQPSN